MQGGSIHPKPGGSITRNRAAVAARRVGACAKVFLPANVNRTRVGKIAAMQGSVISVSGTYDDAVDAAREAAARGEGLLIPDSSRDPDDLVVGDVMQGYSVLVNEIAAQLADHPHPPTHAFIQAGVGGLAAAVAEGLTLSMRRPPAVIVVEPETAACVTHALQVGEPVKIAGDLRTSAEMLSAGLASASALKILLAHGARAITVNDSQLRESVKTLRTQFKIATTPSGAAGLAGLKRVASDEALRSQFQLTDDSSVLLIVTEGCVK
jgi:diaminopropionate ammonia-lyase